MVIWVCTHQNRMLFPISPNAVFATPPHAVVAVDCDAAAAAAAADAYVAHHINAVVDPCCHHHHCCPRRRVPCAHYR